MMTIALQVFIVIRTSQLFNSFKANFAIKLFNCVSFGAKEPFKTNDLWCDVEVMMI